VIKAEFSASLLSLQYHKIICCSRNISYY